jgi:hypothetical protein
LAEVVTSFDTIKGSPMHLLRRVTALGLAAIGVTALAFPSAASATPPPDAVRLFSTNLDLGDNTFSNGGPTGYATLTWDTAGGTVTPKLNGYFHLDSARGMHAQIRMEYYDVFGTKLATRYGGTVTHNDDDHHSHWTNGLAAGPYGHPTIYRVNIALTYEGVPPTILTTVRADYYI